MKQVASQQTTRARGILCPATIDGQSKKIGCTNTEGLTKIWEYVTLDQDCKAGQRRLPI
jgi:hypothetical protein